jgi:glucose/arabinose dehydrogenase
LGIAFDPMETNYVFPKVYFSNSDLFHGSRTSSSGLAINGKVSVVSTTASAFTNLMDIITGLPVSDHDHAVNSIVFGNYGELYIAVGGNTNGGRPGKLSNSGVQKESYLSASIVRANIRDPNFNGTITYTTDDDGDIIANGIEVFAHGIRNPFGLMIHSNNNLYATDNGPNVGYGNMLTGCGPNEFIPDRTDMDKLLLLQKDAYYGHPNPKRAITLRDQRQCKWYPTTTTNNVNDGSYTPPIAIIPSAMQGVTEYTANYFDGQMRHNLIVAKYGDELFRFVLSPDGTNVLTESKIGIKLNGTDRAKLDIRPVVSSYKDPSNQVQQ